MGRRDEAMLLGLRVFACFEGEGRRFSAAFQNSFLGLAPCRLLGERTSEEGKGWSWIRRKEGRGEKGGREGRESRERRAKRRGD